MNRIRTLTTPLLLLFICLFITLCLSQYPRRKMVSHSHFKSYHRTYYRINNAVFFNSWTITTDIYFQSVMYNMDLHSTSSINSISSSRNSQGYELQPEITYTGASAISVSIADTSVNQMNAAFVWYSFRFMLFLVPKDSPISIQTVTAMIYTSLGSSLFFMTNSTFPLQFALNQSFHDTCFYDAGKTIKDRVHLVPSLNKVSIENAHYVNLTSAQNWSYDWATATPSVNFSVVVSTYISQALYVVVKVIGMCPNSYMFTSSNYSVSLSPLNWFEIPSTTAGQTLQKAVPLSTPLANDIYIMLGLSITGISLHDGNFAATFLSANISSGLQSNQGNLSYYSLMPQSGYISYWAMGMIGDCASNFQIWNSTHCYCNPAMNLTFDVGYSLTKCRAVCPSSHYFSAVSSSCVACQVSYSFLCATCDETTCFNCTNGMPYQLINSVVYCLNCTALYGPLCLSCTDTICLNCSDNYIVIGAGPLSCKCLEDRYIHLNLTCVLCITTFPFCATCIPLECLSCLSGYLLNNGSCSCPLPYIVVNGECMNCSQLYGEGCLLCDNLTCLGCAVGYMVDNNSTGCIDCATNYGVMCDDCNQSQCLNCLNNYTLGIINTCICQVPTHTVINDACTPCEQQYPFCLTCDSLSCLSCQPSFQLTNSSCLCPTGTYSNTTACISCTTAYPYCLTCNPSSCLQCAPVFLLANNTCTCSGDRYLDSSQNCALCSQLGCLECASATECTLCSVNFNLSNGSCECGEGILAQVALNGSTCLPCSSLFSPDCVTCTSTGCLSCRLNYQLAQSSAGGSNCTCNLPFVLLSLSRQCLSCPTLHDPYCSSCTNITCLTCSHSRQLINSTCSCSSIQFVQTTGDCSNCSITYANCLTCSQVACLVCAQNYTILSQGCVCASPMTEVSSGVCLACGDGGNPGGCSLTVEMESFQRGDYIYFRLIYNQDSSEITHLIPIEANIEITIANIITPFTYSTKGIFTIHLNTTPQQINNNSTLDVAILHPNYIKYGQLVLSNQPGQARVKKVESLVVGEQWLKSLFKGRRYLAAGLLLLSFGGFNRMFQESNLISFISFTLLSFPNSFGIAIDRLNNQTIYWPVSPTAATPFSDLVLPTASLPLTTYNISIPLPNLAFQMFLLATVGLGLILYVRGYLFAKHNPRRHKAYRNIMDFSSQYMLMNWVGVCSALSFPAGYQLQLMLKGVRDNGVGSLSIEDGLTLASCICLLLLPFCLLLVHFISFWPTSKRYSILYCQLKSQKALVVILSLLSLLRPYIISLFTLLLPHPLSLYCCLSSNFLHLFLLIICTPYRLSLASHLFLILKGCLGCCVGLVVLSVSVSGQEEETLMVRAGAYAVLGVVVVEMLEALWRLVRLVLRNKNVIDDSYDQIEDSSEVVAEKALEKRKQMTNKMMSFLSKARDQLGQLLKNRQARRNA